MRAGPDLGEQVREPCPFDRLTRWEFELKGDRALIVFDRLSRMLAEIDDQTGERRWGLRDVHASILAKQLTITTEPVDRENKNQSRAEPSPDWLDFLAEHDETILAPEVDERPVEQLARETGVWLVSQVASTLATVEAVAGREFIDELIGRQRRSESARHALYREHRDEASAGLWSALG